MLDWTEIWDIWNRHLKAIVMFFGPLQKHFCFAAGRIILLQEATAINHLSNNVL